MVIKSILNQLSLTEQSLHHQTQYKAHTENRRESSAPKRELEKLSSFLLPDSAIHYSFPKVLPLGFSY